MKEKIISLIQGADCGIAREQAEKIADKIIADKWIRVPLEIGQACYYILFGKIYEGECRAISIHSGGMQVQIYDCEGDHASIGYKNVFATEQAAKQALADRRVK